MPEVLPELGALAAAGLLLLIAAALWVIQGLLKNSLGRLPVVGSWITSNLDAALNDARNAVLSGASSSWGAAVQLFRWLEDFIRNPMAGILFAFAEVYSFGRKVVDVYLPDAQNAVLIWASDEFNSAETYAKGLWDSATAYVNSLVNQALVTASGWVTGVWHDTVSLYNSVSTAIVNGIATAETDAANAVANASTALQADITSAENWAAGEISGLAASTQAAINTLSRDITSGIQNAETIAATSLAAGVSSIYTDLDQWADQAIADAWPDAAGELDSLRNTLGADFPWLNDLIGALGGLGTLGLAGALIRSMATSQALTRLADDCIVPNCRNLSGLGNDLSNLLSVGSTAAMLAWLIFGVVDPAGWAADMSLVARPIASGTADAAAKLFQGG